MRTLKANNDGIQTLCRDPRSPSVRVLFTANKYLHERILSKDLLCSQV